MTITHEIDREEVMAYLDGEIAAARAVVVRAHLDQCAECRAIADDLREVSVELGEWAVEPAPLRLAAPAAIGPSGYRVIGLLEKLARPMRPLQSRMRWGLAAACAIGVVAIAVSWNALRPRPAADAFGQVSERNAPVASTVNGVARPQGQAGQAGNVDGALRSLGYVSSGGGDASKTSTLVSGGASPAQTAANNQMIVRTASVSLSTEKFDDMRAALERVAVERHGSVASLTLAGDPPNQRSMSATLRVPITEMDAALAGVRALGRVLQESQSSEDVTDAHRDLAIRISNAKIEEARLGEILKERTGRLSDVLAVEQAQSRVRTEIEQMEAQELAMRNRAALSTISIEVAERYRAELADNGPLPTGTRLRNAVVDGARTAFESLVGVSLAVLGAAPTLLIWAVILFLPARWVVRRMRRRAPVTT
jgi:hypothetical protein